MNTTVVRYIVLCHVISINRGGHHPCVTPCAGHDSVWLWLINSRNGLLVSSLERLRRPLSLRPGENSNKFWASGISSRKLVIYIYITSGFRYDNNKI